MVCHLPHLIRHKYHLALAPGAREIRKHGATNQASKQIKPPSDDVLAALTDEQDLKFSAMATKSHFVRHTLTKSHFVRHMSKHVPGLTAKSFLSSGLTATDSLMGPVEYSFVMVGVAG